MAYLTDLPGLNAIKIGNLFFKPKNGIEELVAKSVRLVTLEAREFPSYLGKGGSCTLISRKSQSYVVCTRHQLGIEPGAIPDKSILETARFVSLHDPEFLSNIPTDNCLFVTDNEAEELHDVLLFCAAKGHPAYDGESSNFFPVADFIQSKRHASWIVGYPSDLNLISYDPQRLSIVAQMFDCSLDNNYRSNARHLRRYTYDPKYSAVDGFSGGAIFSLIGDAQEFEIVLDGIVLRAGEGFAHAIDVNFLVLAIKKGAKL